MPRNDDTHQKYQKTKRLEELREARPWKIQRAADYFNVGRDTYRNWEFAEQIPHQSKKLRECFITYLWKELGLHNNREDFDRIWIDIMEDTWNWDPVSPEEELKYLQDLGEQITPFSSRSDVPLPTSTQEKLQTSLFPKILSIVPWWGWISIGIMICIMISGVIFLVREIIYRSSEFPVAQVTRTSGFSTETVTLNVTPEIATPGSSTETTIPDTSTETVSSEEFIVSIGSPIVQRRLPNEFLSGVALSPDNRYIAIDKTPVDDLKRIITLYDVETLEEAAEVFHGEYAPLNNGLTFSPDGQILAAGNMPGIRIFYGEHYSPNRTVSIGDVSTDKPKIVFRANGQLMFAHGEGQVVGWNTTDWREIFRTDAQGLFDVTSDGQTIAVQTEEIQRIEIWDVATGNKKTSFISQHLDPIDNIEFLEPDNLLLTIAPDKLSVWNIETGEEITKIEGTDKDKWIFNEYYKAANANFSPNIRFVILQEGTAGQLIALALQNTKTKKLLRVVEGTYKEYEFEFLALSPDGTMLVGASENPRDGTLKVWTINN